MSVNQTTMSTDILNNMVVLQVTKGCFKFTGVFKTNF